MSSQLDDGLVPFDDSLDNLVGLREERQEAFLVLRHLLEHPQEIALFGFEPLAFHLDRYVRHDQQDLDELVAHQDGPVLERERLVTRAPLLGQLIDRHLYRQDVLQDAFPGTPKPRDHVGISRRDVVPESRSRDERPQPFVDDGRALRRQRAVEVDGQEPLTHVVQDQAHVGVALEKLVGSPLDDLLQADHVVEEAARHETGRHRFQDHERGVHDHGPDRGIVVEYAARQDKEENQVVQSDRDRRRDDHDRVREHRQQSDEDEEIEMHLDLHGTPAKVHQQAPHAHRREPVDHRQVPRVAHDLVGQHRPHQHQRRQQRGLQSTRAREQGDADEYGDVAEEKHQRDSVHAGQVRALEFGYLGRQQQIRLQFGHSLVPPRYFSPNGSIAS